jgi:signal transduction histidine kinase
MSDAVSLKSPARWEAFGADPAGNSAIKILTVDDNEALRYSLVRSLRDAGYQVIEARTGAEAIALAANLPDLITLDVNLPDINGFQVCRQLKSNPVTTHIPILHVSSTFVGPEARVQGLAGGADAYLAEPIDRSELVATVAALLRLKQAENRARQEAESAESARRELAQLNATLENRVSERTRELKVAIDSLRELSARLLQMQDEERRRIARDLHDSVGQLLVAITMNRAIVEKELDKLSPAGKKAFVENGSFVEQILRDIRTISHLLHPPLLDESGLPSALRWYVEEFSERSGTEVTLECSTTFGRFSSALETAIFRIVQECLGNIHRHSQSQTARIRLDVSDGMAHLVVSDNGQGISPEKQQQLKSGVRTGVGLRGMRERVAQLGGDFYVDSDSSGTTVRASLPCVLRTSGAGDTEVA